MLLLSCKLCRANKFHTNPGNLRVGWIAIKLLFALAALAVFLLLPFQFRTQLHLGWCSSHHPSHAFSFHGMALQGRSSVPIRTGASVWLKPFGVALCG
jgi:hypothetical protein